MSLFLFFFCLMRVSSVFIFTVVQVKRKLKLALDVEADFLNFEIEVGHYIVLV